MPIGLIAVGWQFSATNTRPLTVWGYVDVKKICNGTPPSVSISSAYRASYWRDDLKIHAPISQDTVCDQSELFQDAVLPMSVNPCIEMAIRSSHERLMPTAWFHTLVRRQVKKHLDKKRYLNWCWLAIGTDHWKILFTTRKMIAQLVNQ